MPKYLACKFCMGKTIEGEYIVSACLRWLMREKDYDYKFPDNCPKKARGVQGDFKPKWIEITEREFNLLANINNAFNTPVRLFRDD